VSYTIVGPTEVDLAQNKISNESPLGEALMGAKKNQIVEANTPGGIVQYKILSIKK
ncbi:MAG: GreA/GreB family elongation factor, partial [Clostridia bacterium]|nr:GreA/GreB family elongation factor [Clostridia bacterium]